MLKISFIGAGSLVFAENVITDILSFPELRKDTLICLEDVDANRLDLMYQVVKKVIEDNPETLKDVQLEKTTDQKKAIKDAKYIINAINVGGLEALKHDLEIPLKYGVSQAVGDTLGPGGVFRFLRNAPIFDSIMKDIQEIGYHSEVDTDKPIFLNYTNPMAMNTWYCNSILPDSTVGLCHGVQGTAMTLCLATGAKMPDFSFFCAGINHMAWFLELWYKDKEKGWKNAYPRLIENIEKTPMMQDHERLRIDMMKATGYFMTESCAHLSEYLPYYRKREELIKEYSGKGSEYSELKQAAYYEKYLESQGDMEKDFEKKLKKRRIRVKKRPSTEYASHIINAMETNQPFRFNGNVINKDQGLITNLPNGCCVEVPVFADSHGLHPQGGITLPTICQGLCNSNVMVQKAAVEGALDLDKESIYHAVLLDPNTASVCSPSEVREMVEEMFKAEQKWIPKLV